jgi:hypothetical protein
MKPNFLVLLLVFSLFLFDGALSRAALYSHDVMGRIGNPNSYTVVSVKLIRPETALTSHPRSLVLELPLCERTSVKKIDQYCATEDGTIGKVTALTGFRVGYSTPDLSEEKAFAAFMRVQAPGRTLASEPGTDVDTVCQASCFRLRADTCQAKGSSLDSAFVELNNYFKTNPPDCSQCNLAHVVCNGKLLSDDDLLILRKQNGFTP